MRFIIVGKVNRLEKRITTLGGEVVASFPEKEAAFLSKKDFNIPEADYLINFFSSHILKTHTLNKFSRRALNVHNGKLPEYAGIHVHQWAIRNGEDKTTVTIHYMTEDVDLGDIVAERDVVISENDTGLTLYRKTQSEGLDLMSSVIGSLLSGKKLISRKQDVSKRVLYSHKDALDSKINWKMTAFDVRNFIRAGSYYPLESPTYTATLIDENYGEILLLSGSVEGLSGVPGTILNINDHGPLIACGRQSLRVTRSISASGVKIDWNKASLVL